MSVSAAFDGVEGQRDGYFSLRRDDLSGPLTVGYTLTTTPLSGPPGPAVPGWVTFAPGEELADLLVPAADNALRDGHRDVTLLLMPGPGYVVDQPAPGRIGIGDDEPESPAWIDSTLDAIEGEDAGYVRLRRFDTSAAETFSYAVDAAGTTATQGVDFAPLGGSVAFAVGQATVDIVVDPTGTFADTVTEGDEYVSFTITPPVGGAIPQPVVVIKDARPGNRAPVFTLPAGAVDTPSNSAKASPAGPMWAGSWPPTRTMTR